MLFHAKSTSRSEKMGAHGFSARNRIGAMLAAVNPYRYKRIS
jgi:hypothetical protein